MASATVTIVGVGVRQADPAPAVDFSSDYCRVAPDNNLNMTSVPDTSAITGVGTWALTPGSTTLMPCAVFADPPSTCYFTSNTSHPCQSGTVFFGTASADPAASASTLVLTFTLTVGFLINVDAFPVQQVNGWSFESDGVSKRLRVTRGVGASGLPWVSSSVNELTVLAVFSAIELVTDSPSFGMQAVALSSTSAPPAACFGPGTLVL
jgi:hypothetical protein